MGKQYQDFGDGGDSKSPDKLQALEIPVNMEGKRVLDLGCNAGFFCIEAARRGATCIGIEANSQWFDEAVLNAGKYGFSDRIEFINGNWADEVSRLDEKFDYIFWLSAIHYEKNQRTMVKNILSVIKPDGVFILECGLIGCPGDGPVASQVTRAGGSSVLHFSLEYLRTRMMAGLFSTKLRGMSVQQEGDRVPRWVIHCYPKTRYCRIIHGDPAIGKTTHSVELARATGSVLVSSDDFFADMFAEKLAPVSVANASLMRECFNKFNKEKQSLRIDLTTDHLIESGHAGEIVEMFTKFISVDFDYVFEGYLPEPVLTLFKSKLGKMGFVIWETTRFG